MDMNRLSPYVRVAYGYRVPCDWTLYERVIFDYELLYFKEGQAEITLEGQVYACGPGDIFLIKPGQAHIIQCVGTEENNHLHVHFDLIYEDDSPLVRVNYRPTEMVKPEETAWFREDKLSGDWADLPNLIRLNNPVYVEKMLIDIINDMENKFHYYEFNVKGIMIQLLIYIIRELHWSDNAYVFSHWEIMNRVKNYIRMNPDLHITLDEMAKMANFSKSHFLYLFKSSYGITPMKYRQIMQIEKAKKLIQFTDRSITDIATQCGFASIHAFSATFKKIDGVKPSYYRQKAHDQNFE